MSTCACTGRCRRPPYTCDGQTPGLVGQQPAPQPHGCICPPGSEATCQGFACPRRNPFAGTRSYGTEPNP
jgi:hypothetical protein